MTVSCLDHTGVDPKCKMRNIIIYTAKGDYQADKKEYCGILFNQIKLCNETNITSKKCGTAE